MKKTLKLTLSILTFFVMIPISYILAWFMLLWYQGNGFNGIFQLVIVICIVLCVSFTAAKSVYDKLK